MNWVNSFSFTKKYLFALFLIASFSVLAYFNLSNLIDAQADDAEVINISGRQRMLSQEVLLFSLLGEEKNLQKDIKLMEKSHSYLISRPLSSHVHNIYFGDTLSLDKQVRKYLDASKEYLQSKNKSSLQYMLQHNQTLLKKLDSVVSVYQEESEHKIKELQKYELYILLLVLLTLFFEVILIFMPTNRKIIEKEKALREQKQYLDTITDTNTNAIIVVDETFKISTFNKSAEKMFGYSATEMLATYLRDDRIIPKKYLAQHNAGLSRCMEKERLKNSDTVYELEGKRKDGSLFPIRISFGTHIENNHKIVVANIQDITKEKEQDELLLAQSKFAAMGEMMANIAHQWRQPLSSITTVATGTKIRYKNNLLQKEDIEAAFDKIKDYTYYLSNTIDDFKDFFSDKHQEETFVCRESIMQAISLVEIAYKDCNIKICMENMIDESVIVQGSGSELIQVLLNILNNAKDILLEKEIESKMVLIKSNTKDNLLFIEIYDNAKGIPDTIKHKIYEPYFTTKEELQGTGIGLFMSKKIIEQHFFGTLVNENREFICENKHYFGACFTITLKVLL